MSDYNIQDFNSANSMIHVCSFTIKVGNRRILVQGLLSIIVDFKFIVQS